MPHRKAHNSGFHHLFHFHIDVEILEMMVSQLFYYLGRYAFDLMIPFYLYFEKGYSVWQIFVFYIFWQVSFLLVVFWAGPVIKRLGIKHSIFAQRIMLGIFFGLFPLLIQGDFWNDMFMLLPLFFFRALFNDVFYVSYDAFLIHHINREKKGSILAWLQIMIVLAALLSPIIGGVLTKFFSFSVMSYFAFTCLFLSGIVLLLTPDEKFKIPYTPKKLALDTLKNTPKNLFYAEFSRVYFDSVLWILWPVFLVIILKDSVSLGVLMGVSSGISLLVAYFIGKMIDKHAQKGARNILKNGALRAFILNFIRGIVWNPIILGFIDSLNRINDQTMKIPYDVELYKWIHKKNTFERCHIRWVIAEYFYMISIVFFAATFYFLEVYTDYLFFFFFVSGAISLLLMQRISKLK